MEYPLRNDFLLVPWRVSSDMTELMTAMLRWLHSHLQSLPSKLRRINMMIPDPRRNHVRYALTPSADSMPTFVVPLKRYFEMVTFLTNRVVVTHFAKCLFAWTSSCGLVEILAPWKYLIVVKRFVHCKVCGWDSFWNTLLSPITVFPQCNRTDQWCYHPVSLWCAKAKGLIWFIS